MIQYDTICSILAHSLILGVQMICEKGKKKYQKTIERTNRRNEEGRERRAAARQSRCQGPHEPCTFVRCFVVSFL